MAKTYKISATFETLEEVSEFYDLLNEGVMKIQDAMHWTGIGKVTELDEAQKKALKANYDYARAVVAKVKIDIIEDI